MRSCFSSVGKDIHFATACFVLAGVSAVWTVQAAGHREPTFCCVPQVLLWWSCGCYDNNNDAAKKYTHFTSCLQERALSALRKLLVVENSQFVPPAAVEAADAEGVPACLRM